MGGLKDDLPDVHYFVSRPGDLVIEGNGMASPFDENGMKAVAYIVDDLLEIVLKASVSYKNGPPLNTEIDEFATDVYIAKNTDKVSSEISAPVVSKH